MIPIQCTACGGLSQIDEAWIGRPVECPHCHRPTVATPASAPPPPPSAARGLAPPPPPPTPIPIAPEQPTPAEPAPKRPPLTRAQREAIRRRRHLILALGGGIILFVTAYALFLFRGDSQLK